ncbi:MAG: hypothetical protein CTY20_01185 [Hyphomicrobium sp.]|nr:MAG: hypothetical protein CTY20_01185 [Hyphomicrobium sp.]
MFVKGSLFRMLVVAALLLVTAAAATVAARAQLKPETIDLEAEPIDIAARPIATFDKGNASKTRFGRLEWRGGLVLTSPSENFGGWSGLAVDPDGRGFVAVSDAGTWLTGQIAYDGTRPSGIKFAKLGPLQSLGAKNLKKNRDRDAEAVVIVDGTTAQGSMLISFEQNQRIGRFDIDGRGVSPPRGYLEMPAELQNKKRGDGLEAMTVIKGGLLKGSVIGIAEHFLDSVGRHTGWIWVKGKPQKFHLTDIGGFNITDTASLPDGTLLILERRFRWLEGVKMRLRAIAAAELKPGAVLTGEILIEADLGQEIDNMEALAIHQGPRGETILTMISDDNFNGFLQKTILLQFTLLAEGQAAAR